MQGLEERLLALIREEGLQPGERLPAERILASRLGISRPSLRAALSGLGMAGMIETRPGSGNYVATREMDRLLEVYAVSGAVPLTEQAVLEARLVLEPPVVALAARKSKPADLALMRLALSGMRRDLEATGSYSLAHDRDFHLAMIKGAHNPFLYTAIEMLYKLDAQMEWVEPRNRLLSDAALAESYLQDHEEICTAIALHRAASAERLMVVHTRRMMRDIERGRQPTAEE